MNCDINRLQSLEVSKLLEVGDLALITLERVNAPSAHAQMEIYRLAKNAFQGALTNHTKYVSQIDHLRNFNLMPNPRRSIERSKELNNARIRAKNDIAELIHGWIEQIRSLNPDELSPIFQKLGNRKRGRVETEQRIMPSRGAKRRRVDYNRQLN